MSDIKLLVRITSKIVVTHSVIGLFFSLVGMLLSSNPYVFILFVLLAVINVVLCSHALLRTYRYRSPPAPWDLYGTWGKYPDFKKDQAYLIKEISQYTTFPHPVLNAMPIEELEDVLAHIQEVIKEQDNERKNIPTV